MSRTSANHAPALTPEQQAESDRLFDILQRAATVELRALTDQLATTTDRTIFGANEFAIRGIVHRLGAKAIETALEERKKGGTTARPTPAPGAPPTPASSGGSPAPSPDCSGA